MRWYLLIKKNNRNKKFTIFDILQTINKEQLLAYKYLINKNKQ
jgi:hypothetical protein